MPTNATPGDQHRAGSGRAPVKSGAPARTFEDEEREAAKDVMRLKKKVRDSYETESVECKERGCNIKNKEVRYGGRFLHNRKHIEHQRLFELAQQAPKGAHLHIHLNACLEPEVLLELAASEELKNNMYISVNLQDAKKVEKIVDIRKKKAAEAKAKTEEAKEKAEKQGLPAPAPVRPDPTENPYPEPLTDANIGKAKFQFHFLPFRWPRTRSVFDPNYHGRVEATEKADDKTYDVMKFTSFLRTFDDHIKKDSDPNLKNVDAKYDESYKGHLPKRAMDWLIKKLVFQEGEVEFTEDPKEKAKGTEPAAIKSQWAKFDARTQMMKGLFLAETAYRKYLRGLFTSFDKDKIQYAELRPNFMAANSVIHTSIEWRRALKKDAKLPGEFSFDPKKTMDNKAIMNMIIGEFKRWRQANPKATFKSMKVIMCTPRARGYPIKFIEATMQECLDMKKDPKYKNWIAGFDFVGPEHEGRTLEELEPMFTKFKEDYEKAGLKWILHCGESLYDKPEFEKQTKGNLKWALDNLDPHRLAHGYAIKKINFSQEHMTKLRKCCIETCPSSNEILGLAYDARFAALHSLRSKGIPCSVSCDNPTLFHSTLSHEFYQAMVGDDTFGLMQWKKLMMDSLEHSVWFDGDDAKERVMAEWKAQYKNFVKTIRKEFSVPAKS